MLHGRLHKSVSVLYQNFAEALAEYNAEIFEKPFTDVWTNKLQLVGNRILIQYEYWDDEEEDIIEEQIIVASRQQ